MFARRKMYVLKNISLILLFTIFSLSLDAQMRWGKADPSDFATRICPFDSSANALVVMDSAYVEVEKEGITTHTGINVYTAFAIPHVRYVCYRRILILNKEGIASSNINIPVITFRNFQQVSNLEAQTLNLNDKGKIEVKKLKDESFFYDTLIKGAASNIKFTFPDVKEGSIIEYKYTLTVLGNELNDWLFQGELPVARSAIALKIPDYVYYDIRFHGYLPVIKDRVEAFNDRWNGVAGIKAHFAMENIPAAKKEPFVASAYDNLNKIRFYPEQVRMVNGAPKHFGYTNWNDVAKHLAQTGNYFGSMNNVAWGFLAKQVANGISDKGGKVEVIYNSLHNIIKWNKMYGYTSNSFSQLKSGNDSTGNSAEINLILMGMLRAAGIKAYPVLISTTEHGKLDTALYNARQFNNVIIQAEVDSNEVFLDAISPYYPYYLLPENDLNYWGLKITDTKVDTGDIIKAGWVKITDLSASATAVSANIAIDSAGNYKGKAVFTASDYMAVAFRDKTMSKTVADYAREHLKMPDDIEVKEETVENESDVDKRLRIVFTLEKDNNSPTDSFIYINPFPVKFYADNPFSQNSRTNPISFGFPIQRTISCAITLPKNYKLVELPKSVKMKLNDGTVSFSLMVGQNDMNIQLVSTFKVNGTLYNADMFSDLKAIYAKMIDACNSLIVLQKM